MNEPPPHPTPPTRSRPPAAGAPAAGAPAHDGADPPEGAGARQRAAALAGHAGDATTARRLATDPDGAVRATALGALARLGQLDDAHRATAVRDPDPRVRRRLAEELGRHPGTAAPPTTADPTALTLLVTLLADPDPLTAEAAAWALGEVASDSGEGPALHGRPAVTALRGAAGHDDPLVREAVVAALGAIGDPAGLEVVLAGTSDRPAIRRRAVLALAAFLDEPGVDEALERATADRDWQVRQAAELLRRPDP